MKRLFDLTGKRALVAGGGGYLGRPICEALAAHGASVVVADLREDGAQEVAQAILADGGSAQACTLDVADSASIQSTLENDGPFDVLVNCTFYCTGRPHDELSAEDWRGSLDVTLTGAFELSRAAAKPMLDAGRGSVIHFGSMYGVVSPDPRLYPPEMNVNPPDYGAAKAAVLQLTRYQAVQWGPRGVRVNAVVPGPFPNPGIQADAPAFVERLAERVPLGRVGQAEEIAAAVVYLASDSASFVTGTALTVDGGWTAW